MRATASLIVALLLALAGCLQAPEESVEDDSDPVTPAESADPEPQDDDAAAEEPDATVAPGETPPEDSQSAGDPGGPADEPTDVPSDSEPAEDDPAVSEDEDAAPVVLVNASENTGTQDATDSGATDGEPEADDASPEADEPRTAGDAGPPANEEPPAEDEDEPRTAGDAGPPANEEAPAEDEGENAEPQEDQEPAAWPREGSYARYHVHQGGGSPGGYPQYVWDVDVLVTYANGSWTATCEGTKENRESNGTWTEPVHETAAFAPPRADTNVSEGDNLTVPGFNARCEPTTHPVTVLDANASYETNRTGEPVNVSAFHGYREPLCECQGDEAYWEQEEGLVLEWWFGGRGGGWTGKLLDTDAPME